jgi:hypothetical protein
MKLTRIKIKYSKLGRSKIWGHADEYPLNVDVRLKAKKKMEIVIHESIHYLLPMANEDEVERISIRLTHTLWHEGCRFIDQDTKIPLQDGSK